MTRLSSLYESLKAEQPKSDRRRARSATTQIKEQFAIPSTEYGPPVLAAPEDVSIGDAVGLTPREEDVMVLIAQGATNQVIAERLGIIEQTVKYHLANIFAKYNVSSRTAAAVEYLRRMNMTQGAPREREDEAPGHVSRCRPHDGKVQRHGNENERMRRQLFVDLWMECRHDQPAFNRKELAKLLREIAGTNVLVMKRDALVRLCAWSLSAAAAIDQERLKRKAVPVPDWQSEREEEAA